ncbi:hypothetical protein [Cryobacterium adonitolivorans]|uniref:hypothetical protein n=1 Tax=Cryobacterium adonitolivorans TaxID=1259189 RepID=UPI00106AFBB4|nr:hypothetical protein [Cryobacterium adonitolivorans]
MTQSSAEDIGNRRKRSGRGFAFHYLAMALTAVSANLRRIVTFFEAEGQSAPGETTKFRSNEEYGLPKSRLFLFNDRSSVVRRVRALCRVGKKKGPRRHFCRSDPS